MIFMIKMNAKLEAKLKTLNIDIHPKIGKNEADRVVETLILKKKEIKMTNSLFIISF